MPLPRRLTPVNVGAAVPDAPDPTGLPAGVSALPAPAVTGVNDSKRPDRRPMPPIGR